MLRTNYVLVEVCFYTTKYYNIYKNQRFAQMLKFLTYIVLLQLNRHPKTHKSRQVSLYVFIYFFPNLIFYLAKAFPVTTTKGILTSLTTLSGLVRTAQFGGL